MGLLDSFEKGLERAVNGAFAKTFRSGIEPVDIASALRSDMDKKAAIVSRERILAPNAFVVHLAPSDEERMSALGTPLQAELREVITTHARTQGYTLPSALTISLVSDDRLSTGTLRVESQIAEGRVSWQAVVDVAGRRYPIAGARTVIGRGSDADITISDAGASRTHAEILWDGERAMVRDLGSTNGTKLAGRKISEAALPSDATISIGNTNLVFRVIASTEAPRRPAPAAADDTTRAFDARGDNWGSPLS